MNTIQRIKWTVYLSVVVWVGMVVPVHAQQQFNVAYRYVHPRPQILPFAPDQKMVVNHDGFQYVLGTYLRPTPLIFLLKADSTGRVVWSREYDQPAGPDYANTLSVSHNGTALIVTGTTVIGGMSRTLIFKVRITDGSLVWENVYNDIGPLNTLAKRRIGFTNAYIASGTTTHPVTGASVPVVLAIRDSNGSVIYANRYQTRRPLPNHVITGFTVTARHIAYVGKYYNLAMNDERVAHFKIEPANGDVVSGDLHTYTLNGTPGQVGVSVASPYSWDIVRVRNGTSSPNFAIAGTFLTNFGGGPDTHDVAVFKVQPDGTPLWANRYPRVGAVQGLGRGIYQNQFASDSLSVFTQHLSGRRVSGFLSINHITGAPVFYQQHDYDSTLRGFASASFSPMVSTGGYIALAADVDGPAVEDSYQLMGMNSLGRTKTVCERPVTVDGVTLEPVHEDIRLTKHPITAPRTAVSLIVKKPLLSKRRCDNQFLASDNQCWANVQGTYQLIPCSDVCYTSSGEGYGEPIDCDGYRLGNPNSQDQNQEAINVYPNPLSTTDGAWNIQLNSEEAGAHIQWQLIDVQGKVLQQNAIRLQIGQQTITLPAQQLPSGLYLLQVLRPGHGTQQIKLSKE